MPLRRKKKRINRKIESRYQTVEFEQQEAATRQLFTRQELGSQLLPSSQEKT